MSLMIDLANANLEIDRLKSELLKFSDFYDEEDKKAAADIKLLESILKDIANNIHKWEEIR